MRGRGSGPSCVIRRSSTLIAGVPSSSSRFSCAPSLRRRPRLCEARCRTRSFETDQTLFAGEAVSRGSLTMPDRLKRGSLWRQILSCGGVPNAVFLELLKDQVRLSIPSQIATLKVCIPRSTTRLPTSSMAGRSPPSCSEASTGPAGSRKSAGCESRALSTRPPFVARCPT